jgi:Tfp pilus assembly protein PilF
MLAAAIGIVQRALGAEATPDLHVALATLYLRRGGAADARRELEAALTLDAKCAVAHAYVGGMLLQAGDVAEAQGRLDLAYQLTPNDLVVLMKRAEFWLRLGIFEKARAELKHGLQDGGGAPHVRSMAEAMLLAVEKRSRNSFTRQTSPVIGPSTMIASGCMAPSACADNVWRESVTRFNWWLSPRARAIAAPNR